jgi:hypothetical protein
LSGDFSGFQVNENRFTVKFAKIQRTQKFSFFCVLCIFANFTVNLPGVSIPGSAVRYTVEARREPVNSARRPRSEFITKGEMTMRFMVIVKANKDSEAGVMPSEEVLTEMGKYNEELVKAGVMLAGEGLHPSSQGARVRFSGKKRTVIDGPFPETKELIAGFWLWQVKSKEEAIEWVKRCPNPTGEESEIEIRQVFEAEDFGAEFTPELREQEERLRAQIEERRKK